MQNNVVKFVRSGLSPSHSKDFYEIYNKLLKGLADIIA